jgi:hypothetical protein
LQALTRKLGLIALVCLVGIYYRWSLRAAGQELEWGRDLAGYYDYLGRAFAAGRLELPVRPKPGLLAAPNPWDPNANNEHKMHDMALYNGRYYLYHGAGPALLLFAPWRILTRSDLPERAAMLVMCLGGFLFSLAALLRLLRLAGVDSPLWLVLPMGVALGVCQGVPYLLSRVWVYEIAIAGGYLTVAGGVWCMLRALEARRMTWWLAGSGAMFGLSIACRPHLVFAAAVFGLALLACLVRRGGWRPAIGSRDLAAFALPLLAAGLAAAAYNFLRFGDPFEFGTRFLLAGANQNRVKLAAANVLPGLYYFLACPPEFEPVFPWVRIVTRYPFDNPLRSFPPEYFIEALAGALWLAPFSAAVLLLPRRRVPEAVRLVLWALAGSSAALLLFLTATGFTTQRYAVDFLPSAVLAALASVAILAARLSGWRRAGLLSVLAIAIAFGAVVSMALGFSGPYEEIMKTKPARYVTIARWFSLSWRLRPVLNARVDAHFTAAFSAKSFEETEPVFSMGHRASRYLLAAHHRDGKVRLESRTEGSTIEYDMGALTLEPRDYRISYGPETGSVNVAIDGRQVLTHRIGVLITAPVEVMVGEAKTHEPVDIRRFTGRMSGVEKQIGGQPIP